MHMSRSLDLSGNPLLASPIPFAATVARGLQALRITWDVDLEEWCSDMQWKLRCFPGLKVRWVPPLLALQG